MDIKSYKDHDLEELYKLWREVAKERPYAPEKDIEEFEETYLKTFTREDIKCLLAYDGSELIGACILDLRPKDANPYLNFLVPKEILESEISKELLKKSIKLCKGKGKSEVVLSPNIYPQEFIDFFKRQRFKKIEQYPSGLWMKKNLEDLSELKTTKGIDIFAVEDLEGPISARDLAEVQVNYANPNYDVKEIIDEFEKLDREQKEISYSIAKLEKTEEVVGYSRTVFIDLVRGDSIAKNVGLVVKKEQRRKGIGEALLVDSFHRAKKKGYDKMYISTHSEDLAQRLYRRVGFELEREQPNLCYEIDK